MLINSDAGSTISPNSGEVPKKLIVVMHGYGADSSDLISIGDQISHVVQNAIIKIPNAFEPCETGTCGYQWFSLGDWSLETSRKEIINAEKKLNEYLDELLKKYSLTNKDVALVGFSQGAMMALQVGIKREVKVVIAFSGILLNPLILNEVKRYPALLITHGDLDNVLSVQSFYNAKEEFEKRKIPVHAVLRNGMSHAIDGFCVKTACELLAKEMN